METTVSEPLKVANGTYDVLLNGKGSVTVSLPDEYPHCFYIPPQNIYPPGIVAAEEFFRTHEVLFLLLTAS